ncbi:uncharacterized protein DDB_G0284459-like [Paramacrobiotus metropolitanus]|uniref:uncharacterized protein DDB_G0284459-like n=1 Tax=Paramacrobiotus metropolitanus TaxID=2943436 RepID=UPI002445AD14|nr:uncharacterized protein DDB_G0284459-like [Paramacrobiotus metropolitanus]
MSLARLLSRSVSNCTRGFECGVSSYLVTHSSRQWHSSAFLQNDCVTKGSFRGAFIPSIFAVRHKSDKAADRQPPASTASEVNRVFEEEADKLPPPPAKPFEPGVKADPQRMARMMHPRWEEASADTGGYIKLDDIGFDERDVDAKSRELLSKDERLKKWDPKDTGRQDELPYGLLKKKQEKEKQSEKDSGKDEKTEKSEAPEKKKDGKIQEREEEGKSGKKNKQEEESVSKKSGKNARHQENDGEDDEKNGERDEVQNQSTVKKEGKSGKKKEEEEKSSSKKSGKNMRQQENDGEDDEENQVNDKVKNQSMAKKEAEKGKKNKHDEPSTSKKSRKNERQEEDDEDNIEEKKDEADAKRSPAQSTQQTVLWESSRRSTSGAQSSSDGGGMGQLTEQLLDRDEADARTERQLAEEQEEGREKWKEKENEQGAGRQRKE